MTQSDLLVLFEYNYWATRRLLVASEGVSHEQFVTPTAHSFGSLRGTLVHTLDSEHGWRVLCQQGSLAAFRALAEEDLPTLGELVRRWQEEEAAMRGFLADLTDEALTGVVRYTTDEGDKRERVLWHCLWHVVNHGTQHRSEAAAILTNYGCSPDSLDFTAFLNEQGG